MKLFFVISGAAALPIHHIDKLEFFMMNKKQVDESSPPGEVLFQIKDEFDVAAVDDLMKKYDQVDAL